MKKLLFFLLLLSFPAYAGLKAVTTSSSSGSSGITVNSTTITGGTNGYNIYDNNGVVGEQAVVPGANGGTGVANTGHTITIGSSVIMSGAYQFTGTLTGATSVTFPTSGTLSTLALGGSSTDVQFNSGGTALGGDSGFTYGSGAAVLSTSLTDPLLVGGTTASSTLTLESTSGSGSGDSILFKTGSQVTQMTIGTQTIAAVLPVDLGTCTTTGTCALTTSASAITSYLATVPSRSTGCTLSTGSGGCSGNATGDSGTVTQFTGASTQTITIGSTLPLGFQAEFVQIGTGAVSLSAGSGATLYTPHAFTGSTYGQYSTIGITVIGNSGGSAAVATMTGDGK